MRIYPETGTMGWLYAVLLTMAVIGNSTSAHAADGDATRGSHKAKACQVCHGKGGRSTKPTYPVLAGQHAKYIVKQLKAFKAGTRKDPIMNGMAATLNEQDMLDVAAFFSGNRKNPELPPVLGK
jgi:cytochrome c553